MDGSDGCEKYSNLGHCTLSEREALEINARQTHIFALRSQLKMLILIAIFPLQFVIFVTFF